MIWEAECRFWLKLYAKSLHSLSLILLEPFDAHLDVWNVFITGTYWCNRKIFKEIAIHLQMTLYSYLFIVHNCLWSHPSLLPYACITYDNKKDFVFRTLHWLNYSKLFKSKLDRWQLKHITLRKVGYAMQDQRRESNMVDILFPRSTALIL